MTPFIDKHSGTPTNTTNYPTPVCKAKYKIWFNVKCSGGFSEQTESQIQNQ